MCSVVGTTDQTLPNHLNVEEMIIHLKFLDGQYVTCVYHNIIKIQHIKQLGT